MDEIIFENRNKAYGAFQLRQISDKNATYGLLATTSAIVVFTLIALFMPHAALPPLPKVVESAPTDLVEILQAPTPVIPKPITPPKSVEAPTSQTFTEMTPVVETSPTTNEPPKQIDLANSTAVVSTETHVSESMTASLSTTTSATSVSSTAATETPVKPAIVKWAEVMPSFVGGNEALAKYLRSHITMDSRDVEIGLVGKVVIQFYIDIDGSVKDAKVVKDEAGGRCAERALAVINNMPKWIPGKQGDKAVRVYHTLPITFQVK